MAELSLSQFSIYANYARQQKVYQPNLKNINEYVGQLLGNKKNQAPQPIEEENDGQKRLSDVNDLQNFIDAKNRLKERTGKESVSLPSVVNEIKQFATLENLRNLQGNIKEIME